MAARPKGKTLGRRKQRLETTGPGGGSTIRRGRAWWPAWLAVGTVFLGTGAWAYQEWHRAPVPPPLGAPVPEPVAEPMSRLVPAGTTIFVRAALHAGWLDALVGAVNRSGALGAGGASRGQVLQGLVMGLHALMGYPLMTGEGTNGIEAMQALGSSETAEAVGRLLEGIDTLGCAIYPDPWRRGEPGVVWLAHPRAGFSAGALAEELMRIAGSDWRVEDGHLVHRDGGTTGGLSSVEPFRRSMAGLPDDRSATLYLDAAGLREMLGTGIDLGQVDPGLERLLTRLEAEGADRAHYGFAMTHRLGLVQTFASTDWQIRDAARLRSEALGVLTTLIGRFGSLSPSAAPL